MLGYLASWTVHNGGIGGHGVVFPALHAGRHVFAVGLHVEDCELTDEGVAWMLFGGWGGLRPPGLAKSVWQAGYALASREQNLEGGEGDAHAARPKNRGNSDCAKRCAKR